MINNDNLKNLIYDFFFNFSRFEFTLKVYKYRTPGRFNNNAEADWKGFIRDFEKAYKPCESANQLLSLPPRRQIIKNGNLDWDDLSFNKDDSLLKRVAISIIHNVINNCANIWVVLCSLHENSPYNRC
jgi:hypothetical protein